MDLQRKKFPNSVLSYYVQLYCKRRKFKSNIKKQTNLVAEATRSWFNLSASKKKIFTLKYDNYHLRLRKQFADRLRNTIPYSKNNDGQASDCINTDDNLSLIDTTGQTSILSENNISPAKDPGAIRNTNTDNNISCSVNEEQHADNRLPDLQHCINIQEPTPLKFSKAKELYYIIKSNEEDVVKWECLTRAQKAPYDTAAVRIKRLYLMQYTIYLESLSDTDLLAHYNKIFKNNDKLF